MPYGKIFLESLPRYGTTHEVAEVSRFLKGRVGRKAANSANPS
jgi:hypothetical protein